MKKGANDVVRVLKHHNLGAVEGSSVNVSLVTDYFDLPDRVNAIDSAPFSTFNNERVFLKSDEEIERDAATDMEDFEEYVKIGEEKEIEI